MIDSKAFTELKSFLNKLFQFESQDLDFGIYKILSYKREEIGRFINHVLKNKVLEEFEGFDKEQIDILRKKLDVIEAIDPIKAYNKALSEDYANAQVLLQYFGEGINDYLQLKKQYETALRTANSEETVYNHLTQFFSRYYDKGDFISKRRFGKSEKYVVPYNGEETYFYWANHDQYYIKSSEFFQQFSFKIPMLAGTLTVHFKLAEAQTEQGNVKANENRYFVLSAKPPLKEGKELSLYFEYRPLTEAEKKGFTGNNKQDTLNQQASAAIKAQLGMADYAAELWKEDENGLNLLLKKLNHYTRKNSYDFFIHKDLKGFLQRELDFYIKSELVQVEDLYVLDSERHFENIKHNFKLIKCFKNIADTLIDFLAQVEDFQKKLWEKKKFVLNTEWVVSIDKLAGWLPAETLHPLLQKVLANPAQVAEWKELFGWKDLPFALTIDGLKADLHTWRKLPVDTQHFDNQFKNDLLNALSGVINLEEEANGLVIHSDNYHGLKLLEVKFSGKIQSIYIDPPYNTSASEIIYKNSFRNSSWVSLISDRIKVGKRFLKTEGILCATIDDVEFKEFSTILENEFSKEQIAGKVSIRINPSGRPTAAGFAISHEYAIFCKNSGEAKIQKMPRTEEQLSRFDNLDKEGIFEWRNFRREGSNSNREDGKRQWFPIYADVEKGTIRVPKMEWNDFSELWEIKEKNLQNESIIYPINDDGVEKNWRWSEENVRDDYTQFEAKKNGKSGDQIYYKYRPNEEGVTPLTLWFDSKYSATEHGTKTLKDIFNVSPFSYPKSIWAVKDCLYLSGLKRTQLVLDFFPGSGTTFHAMQLLNNDDQGLRKCILIEQGPYVNSVINPRIKKIGYSFKWKDSKPEDMNGLGIFFKYQRLEQYEESLENIAFTQNRSDIQQVMQFDQYLPKYFLEMETRESNTLVNLVAMQNPWGYQLKVWDGITYDTQQAVDLVETFNYLVGLHVQKWFTTERNGLKYVGVWGYNNDEKRIWVIWRNTTGWQEADYDADKAFIEAWVPAQPYEVLYVNHQCTVPGSLLTEEVFKTQMIPA